MAGNVSHLLNTTDCLQGWEKYPTNVDPRHPLLSSASALNDRLTDLAGQLFTSSIDVHVVGIRYDGKWLLPDAYAGLH